MKKTAIQTFALIILLMATSWAGAAPMGTAFTYQGRLYDGGAPANGSYIFRFGLYDNPTVATPLTATPPAENPLTVPGVVVSNGLFTTTIDFGVNLFTGSARWLGIEVRTNSNSSAFAALDPRQELKPTPYALYAASAGSADVASSVSLGAITAAGFAHGAVDSVAIADGSILPADLSPALLGNTFWRLDGNGGTGPAKFLGTTDFQPLELRVNGQRGLRIQPSPISSSLVGGHPDNSVDGHASVIAGGGIASMPNKIIADWSTIAGGVSNLITARDAFIGGGILNRIEQSGGTNISETSFIGGGGYNLITNTYGAFIGGGSANRIINAHLGTIGGGGFNAIVGELGTVSGGANNQAETNAAVVGGYNNHADGRYSFVGGGLNNLAGTEFSAVGGGNSNTVSGYVATIGGGTLNAASGYAATIGGGTLNAASGTTATVAGGHGNRSSGLLSAVGGGWYNIASGITAAVAGGYGNRSSGEQSAVGGGWYNVASGWAGVVAGGYTNVAAGQSSSVGGGYLNIASNRWSTIAGGAENLAVADQATVGGGFGNIAQGEYAAVAGGRFNTNQAEAAVVAGGAANTITINADAATISGGHHNRIEGIDYGNNIGIDYATGSFIAGGERNLIRGGVDAAILGGTDNTAHGFASAVLAGENNSVDADHSVVTGKGALAHSAYSQTHGAMFAQPGDGQSAHYTLTAATAGNVSVPVAGPRLPTGSAFAFTAIISAKAFGDACAGFEVKGLIRNYGTQVDLVGSPTVTVLGRDGLPTANVTVEVNSDRLGFRVSSGSQLNVRWVASLQTSEVSF